MASLKPCHDLSTAGLDFKAGAVSTVPHHLPDLSRFKEEPRCRSQEITDVKILGKICLKTAVPSFIFTFHKIMEFQS